MPYAKRNNDKGQKFTRPWDNKVTKRDKNDMHVEMFDILHNILFIIFICHY